MMPRLLLRVWLRLARRDAGQEDDAYCASRCCDGAWLLCNVLASDGAPMQASRLAARVLGPVTLFTISYEQMAGP